MPDKNTISHDITTNYLALSADDKEAINSVIYSTLSQDAYIGLYAPERATAFQIAAMYTLMAAEAGTRNSEHPQLSEMIEADIKMRRELMATDVQALQEAREFSERMRQALSIGPKTLMGVRFATQQTNAIIRVDGNQYDPAADLATIHAWSQRKA
jgi:hypothetical protein